MRTRRGFAVFALVGLVALSGCGIPLDDEPKVISPPQKTTSTSAAGEPAATGGQESPMVFFVASQSPPGGDHLLGVRRDVPDRPQNVLAALFKGLSATEQERRLQTFIPPATTLLATTSQPDGTLEVDVSEAFFETKADSQIKAVAQIVYTASGLPGVKRVRLLVNAQPRDWPRGDGVSVSTALTPFDYPELNPSSQPDYPPEAVPATTSTTITTITVSTAGTTTPAPSTTRAPDG